MKLNLFSTIKKAPKEKPLMKCVSAGGVLIQNGSVLLCHPTNNHGSIWRLPKGQAHPTETNFMEVASREVLEETGWLCEVLSRIDIEVPEYKTVYYHEDTGEKENALKTLVFYLMKPVKQVQLPDWENDQFIWVKFNQVHRFASPRELVFINRAIDIWSALHEGVPIPASSSVTLTCPFCKRDLPSLVKAKCIGVEQPIFPFTRCEARLDACARCKKDGVRCSNCEYDHMSSLP